jgi:hypothetical protein
VTVADSAGDRERRSASAMLLVHGCMLVVFATTGGIVTSVVVGSIGAFDASGSGLAVGLGLLVEWGFVGTAMACAAFELWIALQLERGITTSARIGAVAMVVGSFALVPTSLLCSFCGFSLFLLPLGWGLAAAIVVSRMPDARFEEEG